MKLLKHMFKQPFVFATGLAALIHSTWALGTLFSGEQPVGWHLVGWLIPALLIAFALDVGQIVTSTEIREHGLTLPRGLTFLVFALATYYLQWLYIAHHMPALELAPGISATARSTAIYMRDAALWVIPALLPLSTLLYTFSADKERVTELPVVTPAPVQVEAPPTVETPALPSEVSEEPLPFGDYRPVLVDLDAMKTVRSAKKPTASANGHSEKALRNKENE